MSAISRLSKDRTKVVIGITGMPGSGKTSAANFASELGYPVVRMGDIVREIAEERGVNQTLEGLGKLMMEIRKEEGAIAIATRTISKVKEEKGSIVIVDGVRSPEEIEEFKKFFPTFIIAITASDETRFKRLFKRRREDDPILWSEFVKRDAIETEVGIKLAISLADYVIENEGSLDELRRKVQTVVRKIAKESDDHVRHCRKAKCREEYILFSHYVNPSRNLESSLYYC